MSGALQFTEAFAAIGASQFTATVGFYRTLFARDPDEFIGGSYVAFRMPGLHLGIFEPRQDNRPEFINSADLRGGLSLVLRVPDLDLAHKQLETLTPARPPRPIQSTKHGREFFAYDPEGNRLIVVESPPTH